MLKNIILISTCFLVSTNLMAKDLDEMKSLTLTPKVTFRAYIDEKKPVPLTDLHASTDSVSIGYCYLSYKPTNKKINSKIFQIIASEPRQDGARIDIFAALKNIDLKVISTESSVEELEEACALPSHPELCDENPSLMKQKHTYVKLLDAKSNQWLLSCTSSQVEASRGIEPSIVTENILFNGDGLLFN